MVISDKGGKGIHTFTWITLRHTTNLLLYYIWNKEHYPQIVTESLRTLPLKHNSGLDSSIASNGFRHNCIRNCVLKLCMQHCIELFQTQFVFFKVMFVALLKIHIHQTISDTIVFGDVFYSYACCFASSNCNW